MASRQISSAAALCHGLLFFSMIFAMSVSADVIKRHGEETAIWFAKEARDRLWVSSPNGLFLAGDQDLTMRFPLRKEDQGNRVFAVEEVATDIWIGSERGVFKIEGEGYQPLVLGNDVDRSQVEFLEWDEANERVWIGRTFGLVLLQLRQDGGALVAKVYLERELIRSLSLLERGVVVGTGKDIYLYEESKDDGRFVPIVSGDPIPNVLQTIEYGDDLYLLSGLQSSGEAYSLYRVRGGRASLVMGNTVIHAACVGGDTACAGGELWYSTQERAGYRKIYRQVGDGRDIVDAAKNITAVTNVILYTDGYIWIGTGTGIYRISRPSGGRFEEVAEFERVLSVNGMAVTEEGAMWAWGETGLYKILTDVDMKIDYNSFAFRGGQVLFGKRLKINGVRYERRDGRGEAFPASDIAGETMGILASTQSDFENSVFRDLSKVELELGAGNIHAAVRDGVGNIARFRNVEVFEFPAALRVALVPFGVTVALLVVLLISSSARYSIASFILRVFFKRMNMDLRDLAKLEPAAVFLRRHYVRNARSLKLGQANNVARIDMPKILEKLEIGRDLSVVLDEAEIEAFLLALAASIAQVTSDFPELAKKIPVVFDASGLPEVSKEIIDNNIRKIIKRESVHFDAELFEGLVSSGHAVVLFRVDAKNANTIKHIKWYVDHYLVVVASCEPIAGWPVDYDYRKLKRGGSGGQVPESRGSRLSWILKFLKTKGFRLSL